MTELIAWLEQPEPASLPKLPASRILTIQVHGLPIPQGSMKGFVVGGRARVTSDNPRTRPWKAAVILAIDPGSSRSAWVRYDPATQTVEDSGIEPNDELLHRLRGGHLIALGSGFLLGVDTIVVEWTAPRGMPASAELFETLWWAGRFAEAARLVPVERLQRAAVKRHLCGTTAAKDSNVRAALIDRFGGPGGKEAAIGRKAAPGPLYGVRADVWQALALAVAWADGARS